MEAPPKAKRIILPSVADFIFLSLFLYLALVEGRGLLNDGDTGYHVRAGELILKTLSIPRLDTFSLHAPPLPWTAHEWLSEAIMALIHNFSGMTGVVIFFCALISLAYLLLFRFVRGYCRNILVAIAITLLAITCSLIHWLARPHIFSLVLMVAWYYILDAYQYRRKNLLYLLPPIMLLWVNLHGGFISGFILLSIFLAGNLFPLVFARGQDNSEHRRAAKALGQILFVSLGAAIINPFGFHILLFPFKLVTDNYLMNNVAEFLSPEFHSSIFKPFLLYVILTIAVLAKSKERLNGIDIVLFLLFFYMSLVSARYIPLFGIIAAPILARQTEAVLSDSKGKLADFFRRRGDIIALGDAMASKYAWSVLAVAVVAVVAARGEVSYTFNPKLKAVNAVEFLKKEPLHGNMFNNDEIGDYIVYSGYPQYKVFIDGRLDMYGSSLLKEYFKVTNFKPGWEEVLNKYKISWIIYNTDSDFSRFLANNRDWRLIYSDSVASIFLKNIPEHQDLIAKYGNVKLTPPEPETPEPK